MCKCKCEKEIKKMKGVFLATAILIDIAVIWAYVI